jgi:hypothetical protein
LTATPAWSNAEPCQKITHLEQQATSRSKTRFTVCTCLRGASRSPQHLINSRLEPIQTRFRGRSFLRGSGHASASRTSRRGTAVYASADHVSELVAGV